MIFRCLFQTQPLWNSVMMSHTHLGDIHKGNDMGSIFYLEVDSRPKLKSSPA